VWMCVKHRIMNNRSNFTNVLWGTLLAIVGSIIFGIISFGVSLFEGIYPDILPMPIYIRNFFPLLVTSLVLIPAFSLSEIKTSGSIKISCCFVLFITIILNLAKPNLLVPQSLIFRLSLSFFFLNILSVACVYFIYKIPLVSGMIFD